MDDFSLIRDWDFCREMPGAHAQYHLHLLNDGRFPATVKLGLLSQGGVPSSPPLTPTAAKTAANVAAKGAAATGAKPGAAAGKGQAPPTPPAPTFQLSTEVICYSLRYLNVILPGALTLTGPETSAHGLSLIRRKVQATVARYIRTKAG